VFEPTGRGSRIALVVSGIDSTHEAFEGAAIRHVRIVQKGPSFTLADGAPGDISGHGTACAGIIHRMAPAAEIVDVNALGPEGRCSRDALVAALRWCVHQKFSVVNMSLGIDVPKGAPLRPNDHKSILDLYELADAAYTAGVVLVAAGPNVASYRTYPGRFKSLIGVGRAPFSDAEGLRTEITPDHEILAPGTDVSAPSPGGGERRWTGTSFASPAVTAHVARIRAARPSLTIEAIKSALHQLAAQWDRSRAAAAAEVPA
jgi:subtilisin family serine protease